MSNQWSPFAELGAKAPLNDYVLSAAIADLLRASDQLKIYPTSNSTWVTEVCDLFTFAAGNVAPVTFPPTETLPSAVLQAFASLSSTAAGRGLYRRRSLGRSGELTYYETLTRSSSGWQCLRPVFTTFKGGFGDCWATASYMLRISELTGRPTLMTQLDCRIEELFPYFATEGSVETVDIAPSCVILSQNKYSVFEALYGPLTTPHLRWADICSHRYLGTKVQWQFNKSRSIAYQLQTHVGSETNCSESEVSVFKETLSRFGYRTICLGKHLSLLDNITYAAQSECFVGIDSGISHMCHSVGVPVHLIRNGLPQRHLHVAHSGNPFCEYMTVNHFLVQHEEALRKQL